MEPNIGIDKNSRKEIAGGLNKLLADSYLLFLKTHGYHWNVKGPMFQTLHLMFETQYTELFTAVDLIAERIRALGEHTAGSFQEFSNISTIKENATNVTAKDMIKDLLVAQETVIKTARSVFPTVEKASDEASADLLTQRIQLHEKTAWMLRSLLEE